MITSTPTWVQLVYLACAVSFILALKGLAGPRTARVGNLIGAGAAGVAVLVPFLYLDLDHVVFIVAAIVIGLAVWLSVRTARLRRPAGR